MDKLFDHVRITFDPKEQTAILQKIHEKYVDDALFRCCCASSSASSAPPSSS